MNEMIRVTLTVCGTKKLLWKNRIIKIVPAKDGGALIYYRDCCSPTILNYFVNETPKQIHESSRRI